ncbi:MAG: hypothetical protein AB8G86_30420 [Saprospiraceae bacterium]
MKNAMVFLFLLSLFSCNKQDIQNLNEEKAGFDNSDSDFIIISDKYNTLKLNFQNNLHDLKGEIRVDEKNIPIKNIKFSPSVFESISNVKVINQNEILVKIDAGEVLFSGFRMVNNTFFFKGTTNNNHIINYEVSHKSIPSKTPEQFTEDFSNILLDYSSIKHSHQNETAQSRLAWPCAAAAIAAAIGGVAVSAINNCRANVAAVAASCASAGVCLDAGFCSASCTECPKKPGDK